jgi:site-specific recombinase XerD
MSEEYTGPRSIKTAPSWRRKLRELPAEPLGSVGDHIDKFTQHLEARPAAKKTVERYTTDARQFDTFVAGTDITLLGRDHIEKFMVHQIEVNSPVTAASKFVSLQQFFKFMAIVAAEQHADFTNPMAGMNPPVYEEAAVQVIPAAFLAELIKDAEARRTYPRGAQDHTFEDARDAAILRIFVDTGVRLAELTALGLSDAVDLPLLTVVGKGKGKGPVMRQVLVGEKTVRAMKRYLRLRQHHPQAASSALWLGKRGPMTPSGIRQTIYRRSERLGQKINPHRFRHTFAHGWKSDPNRHDGDLMELAGWRDVRSMHRYGKSAAAGRALEAQRLHGAPGDKI